MLNLLVEDYQLVFIIIIIIIIIIIVVVVVVVVAAVVDVFIIFYLSIYLFIYLPIYLSQILHNFFFFFRKLEIQIKVSDLCTDQGVFIDPLSVDEMVLMCKKMWLGDDDLHGFKCRFIYIYI